MATATIEVVAKIDLKWIPGHYEDNSTNEKQYVLTLSEDEAKTLNVVANWVGGPPKKRRGHIDSIKAALVSVGVPAGMHDKAAKGSIYLDY